MDDKNLKNDKLKIRSLRYTLMELREINYLKRNGKPIPDRLRYKRCDDFEVCPILPRKGVGFKKFEEKNEVIDETPEEKLVSSNKKINSLKNFENEKENTNFKSSDLINKTQKSFFNKRNNREVHHNKRNIEDNKGDNILNLIKTTVNNDISYNIVMNEIKERVEEECCFTPCINSRTKNSNIELIDKDNQKNSIIKLNTMNSKNEKNENQIQSSCINSNTSSNNSNINSNCNNKSEINNNSSKSSNSNNNSSNSSNNDSNSSNDISYKKGDSTNRSGDRKSFPFKEYDSKSFESKSEVE